MSPDCEYGYSVNRLERELPTDVFDRLMGWMYGQTMSLCDEHGTVIYPWDLGRFRAGLPVVD